MRKQLNVEIRGRIRKAREVLGYSHEISAEKADLASFSIGIIEPGAGSFTTETLIELRRALRTSADYILFGRKEQGDPTTIHAMLSGLDSRCLPYVEELLGTYMKLLHLSGQ